jgi:L-galactose dehydrogenase
VQYRAFGKCGFAVSSLSYGASSLGGVFHDVDEAEAIRAVHAALDGGITYIDVAPAYGATRAETVLGRALKGVARDRYVLSTKVGKYSDANGRDYLNYDAAHIRARLDESAARLGTGTFDILHIHDIEYEGGRKTEQALTEGVETVLALIVEGRVGSLGFGFYPISLWERVLRDYPVDAALIHNHYVLNDTRLLSLLPMAAEKGVGVISASPFASGLLTSRGPAGWHPASDADRAIAAKVAAFCRDQGTSIEQLAFQFACQNPDIPTVMFSSANPASVARNIGWAELPYDAELAAAVQEILTPLTDRDWY